MKYIIFLTALLFFSACGNRYQGNGSPDQVLLGLTNNERYISIDEVAAGMINKDPSLLLVDVREHAAYDQFTLPGAVNMPIQDILLSENQNLLDCNRFMVIFFSNDDLLAEQAWHANQNSCKGSHIMRGGLNEWTASILDVQDPGELATAEDQELYHFRKAVCQYFIGASDELEPEQYRVIQQPIVVKKTIPLKTKKKKVEEEGC